jgi:hypothetical protein
MTKMSRLGSQSIICSLLILSLYFIALVATATSPGFEGQKPNAQNTNSSAPTNRARRPLPKPPSGPRGFEKYAGKDSSSRLIAAGATRETVNPRRPVAPLEGRAYDARPFFAWEIAPGSKAYHFAIYEGDRDKDPSAKIVYEADLTVTELAYPQNAPPLKPGKLYSWRVSTPTATGKDEGVVARLVILAGAEAAEVQKALATAGLTSPKTPVDRLDQARVFENFGVWYDSFGIASDLAQNPNDKEALAYYEALLEKLETKPD